MMMFSRRKELPNCTFIDIHSHILPGIDDGAETFTDSRKMLAELQDQGCKGMIVTPHYILDTDSASTREKNADILKQLESVSGNFSFHLGNELYIDESLDVELVEGRASTLAGSKYILVELPMSGRYQDYEDILAYLNRKYQVILAHPERYVAFQKDFSKIEALAQQDILFQCNYGTLNEQYGKSALKTLKQMLKKKMVFAFATDMHHPMGAGYYGKAMTELFNVVKDEKYFRDLIYNNPSKIID